MLQKYLQKKAESLKQHRVLPDLLRDTIRKVGPVCSSRIEAVNVQLVCSQLLNIAQKLLVSKSYIQIREVLGLINNLLLEIHNDQIYELYIVKIRQFLLSLAIAKHNPSQYSEKQKRIIFFLQKIQNSQFYPLLQEDFYSSLQLVYIEAAKMQLDSANPTIALKSLKSAFQALKKQLTIITEYVHLSCSEKLNRLLERKRKTLQILFYLQYGAHVSNSSANSDKIAEELLPKYFKLFKKIVINFESTQLISKAIKNVQTQQDQDQKEQESQDELQPIQRNSTVSNNSQQQTSSKGLEPYLHSVINSINFIQQLDPYRKNSLKIDQFSSLKIRPSQTSSKISIRVHSNPSIPEQNNNLRQTRGLSGFTNQNQYLLKNSNKGESKFLKEIENMIVEERNCQSKKKSIKQYRTRVFSMVARSQEKDRQRIKKLKIDSSQMDKMKVTKGQMLKNGIILV